ncbi:hypothetical protein DYB26_005350 [Aphanomyces astaci]|uniref:DUF7726 domain-containing protein n=1 Tax=Aphanomyces astaci TaxID=112090 RepID=A0A397D8B5_APHAT|nr:hypothetical protein DYB38_001371 [Aphanomyces astaci]RHZ39880.1 hypothetical protein DYB26_005350 [Aphanomyces astaci]
MASIISTPKGNEGADAAAAGIAIGTATASTAPSTVIPDAYKTTSFLARRDNANDSDSDHSDGDSTPAIAKPIVATPAVVTPATATPANALSEDEYYTDDDETLSNRWTCQTIRSKIQKFLATKTMTQTAFLKTIGANSNSFGRFMKLKGADGGSQNSTYWGSLRFFDRLDKKTKKEKAAAKASGAKAKTAVKRKAADNDDDETPAAKKKKFLARLEQIEAVELAENIKVFDDCDVVRDNIQAFLLTKVMAQTAFSAHLNVSVAALRKFLACKGKREGVGIVYKAAYRFFEKTRLLDNAPKTNKRKKVETDRPQGYSLERDPTHFWVHASEINPKVRW